MKISEYNALNMKVVFQDSRRFDLFGFYPGCAARILDVERFEKNFCVSRIALVAQSFGVQPNNPVKDSHFFYAPGSFTKPASNFNFKILSQSIFKPREICARAKRRKVVAMYDKEKIPFSVVEAAGVGQTPAEPHGFQDVAVCVLPQKARVARAINAPF